MVLEVFQCGWSFPCDFQCHTLIVIGFCLFVCLFVFSGKTETNPQLQSVVATLSTGPVGPSDMLDHTNATLIMRYGVNIKLTVITYS